MAVTRHACPAGYHYTVLNKRDTKVAAVVRYRYLCSKCSKGRFGFGNDTTCEVGI